MSFPILIIRSSDAAG